MSVRFIECGVTPYPIALIDMEIAVEAAQNGMGECVLVTEHECLISAGRSFSQDDFLSHNTEIPVYYPRRGGMVTIHSLGQIVIYPIINLRKRGLNVGGYVSILEEWMIRVLRVLGIMACVSEVGRGVWTQSSKIGFIGIRVVKGIASHGLCLNISNDLELFGNIIPCGMRNLEITSVERILHTKIEIATVALEFIGASPF
jgi:lipoyl(octanoyl) transferase